MTVNSNSVTTLTRRDFLSASVASITALSLLPAVEVKAQTGFRMALTDDGRGCYLNPLSLASEADWTMARLWGESLAKRDEQGRVVPWLADSIATDDGRAWVIRLPNGRKFHNGQLVTANDVAVMLEHLQHLPHLASERIGKIKSMRQVGNDVLFVRLEELDYLFAERLCGPRATVTPANVGGGVGTGAYRVNAVALSDRYLFQRVSADSSLPEKIEVIIARDAQIRFNALQSGLVQVINRIDPLAVSWLSEHSGITVLAQATGDWHGLGVDLKSSPSADAAVWLREIIDSELMATSVYGKAWAALSAEASMMSASRLGDAVPEYLKSWRLLQVKEDSWRTSLATRLTQFGAKLAQNAALSVQEQYVVGSSVAGVALARLARARNTSDIMAPYLAALQQEADAERRGQLEQQAALQLNNEGALVPICSPKQIWAANSSLQWSDHWQGSPLQDRILSLSLG